MNIGKVFCLIVFAVDAFCAVLSAQGVERPVLQFRIEGRHTESDEACAKTFGMFKECPRLCDEIWFGTGFSMPTLPIRREGGIYRVEVPSIGVWNGGFLEF